MKYHLSRRHFIHLSLASAFAQLIGGCSNTGKQIQILFLENSIPRQSIRGFHRLYSKSQQVNFKPETQISQIFQFLIKLSTQKNLESKPESGFNKILGKSIIYPNLTTLGDSWLGLAIAQNVILPLSIEELANWQKLPATWQQLVRRNSQGYPDSKGKIYGAPYRWGSTIIAYNRDKLKELGITLSDWQDLWQPELRGRISLLDSPREVIGLTLKKLGSSYNTKNLDLPNLETELLALNRQTKLYSSDNYLEPLILGDTWAAVAWSTDILPLLKRYPELSFIIPKSGTSLWADLWVKPQFQTVAEGENSTTIIKEWIDYCWQPQTAKQISLFTDGISPILTALKPDEIPLDLQNNSFLNSEILNSPKSEFLLPIPAHTERQYRDLWLKIRHQTG